MQAGQYASYPRPPIQEINFRVIGEGWKIITANWLPFAVASAMTALVYFVVVGLGLIPLFPMMLATSDDPESVSELIGQLAVQVALIPVSILAIALTAPFQMAMSHMALKALSGQTVNVDDAFVGFQRLGQVMIAGGIIGTSLAIGFNCCYLPGFIVGGLTMLTYPLMLARNLSAMDALRESFSLMSKHLVMASCFYLVVFLLGVLGACLCLVGVLITYPLILVCPALVFRDFNVTPVGPVGPVDPVVPGAAADV